MKKFMSFLKDEDGQGMVEYAIIIGLIAVAVIVVLITMRNSIRNLFTRSSGALDNAAEEATT